MKDDLVTYEQAVKLKELGFTYPTFYYIDESDNKTYYVGEFINWNNSNDDIVSIPTLAQAQNWIFEIFRYYIIVSINNIEKWSFIIKRVGKLNDGTIVTEGKAFKEVGFLSPEEALSAGITKCFNYLKK